MNYELNNRKSKIENSDVFIRCLFPDVVSENRIWKEQQLTTRNIYPMRCVSYLIGAYLTGATFFLLTLDPAGEWAL